MINTYDLFITRISHGKLPIPVDIHKNIISSVEKEYTVDNTVSCIQGFQSHKEFKGKQELHSILDNYFKNIFALKLQSGWLNVLGPNSHNKPHSHNGNNISHSGVFYLSDNNNNITFSKNGDIFEIKPKLFEYLIFPNDLIHYVLPENRNEKRICYAFNLEKVI
tara:strand:+ start:47 stop:538 length:492 start_codon:yes stop_codon:yes gene_type:complete